MSPSQFDKYTFYVPPDRFAQDRCVFPPEESRHASRVLRLTAGQVVNVVDGKGGRFRVRLETIDKKGVVSVVEESLPSDVPETPCEIVLAVSPLKNTGRFETMLEKAAEIGVSLIIPLISMRTEKASVRLDRAHSILVSAMKQSGRAMLTVIDEPMPFDAVVKMPPASEGREGRFLCHEQEGAASDLLSRVLAGPTLSSALILIGPEGGFADSEVARAVDAGFDPCSLGPLRLRTETAAVVASALVARGTDVRSRAENEARNA